VQALVHATEDEEKVKTAIANLFPEHLRETLRYERNKVRGHFHNPIIHLETRLTQEEHVKQTAHFIGTNLPEEDRAMIAETFATRVDKKGQFFLRFDKQESYQGRLRIINQGDSLRLAIRFAGPKKSLDDLRNLSRELNLI
jgi:RNA binding exosome subunit